MFGWKNTADVAIIGGGIMGLSTAYHLSRKRGLDVVLFEKEMLAQATTGLSVGGVRQQFSEPANILLSQESLKLFTNINEILETDITFHQEGYLFLARKEESWEEFTKNASVQRNHGVQVELLPPKEIKRRWPYLETSDLKGGSFCAEDGYIDPYMVAIAFAKEAVRRGVRIEQKTEVRGIKVEKGEVKGVETRKGPVFSPRVVNCAGPWGAEVARMAGIELPVKPYRRQVFCAEVPDEMARPIPMVLDFDVSFYFLGYGEKMLMGMSDPEEPSSFNTHVDRSSLEKLTEVAVHRAPLLERAKIVRGWAGLYSITADGNPIIGELPEVKGFFCALGFSGHGFQHGPAVGLILSELISEGKTDFDLSPFAHDRFGKKALRGERRVV
ncbi:MAG: NAD(P)/FAD-dependent oxidoreductase [Candidatus Aminicenantales bacterium]